MDQVRIGSFLRELRKEKELTQEQLAEKLSVSGRTVSRWETGSNLPDISVLVEIAEFYDVTIPEIISGERKSEDMNTEVKETALSLADYAEEINRKLRKRILLMTCIELICFVMIIIIVSLELDESGEFWNFVEGVCVGFNFGITGVQIAYLSGWLGKRKARKLMKNQ